MAPASILALRSAALKSFDFVREIHKRAFSNKFLLITNVSISLGLSTAGDLLEQHYEIYRGDIKEWDQRRTANMGISGMGVGAICHYWYKFLDSRMPGRTIGIVMKKIVLDQFICSPLYISAFFLTMGALEDKSLKETWQEMKDKAWKLYAAEWMVWPPAQFINFYCLPTRYRVVYDNVISLGYDVYTSQVKHND
ncbi:PREDICTED: mpv17-like protein 2 [Rhagoletis zephyria]|uniref:mpv17-like protein 2 n=1 Tax=Rhagoletis zephyria TaxID=28612 RepID=UPI000811565D|nr:PREDICTED: mpv17-like protein 2 [Rhagoletis zephyria]